MRKTLILIILALALAMPLIAQNQAPSMPQSSKQESYLILTENQLKEITSQAVNKAVIESVNIALADYAKKHKAEIALWRDLAIAGWSLAIISGIILVIK